MSIYSPCSVLYMNVHLEKNSHIDSLGLLAAFVTTLIPSFFFFFASYKKKVKNHDTTGKTSPMTTITIAVTVTKIGAMNHVVAHFFFTF